MGIFNTCQQNISYSLNWGENESFYITLFSTFVPIGALIGTTLAGFFISRFGRRLTIMYTDTLYILGSFILVIPLTATFAIGRILTGFCAGIFFTISPIYCSEVTPELMMSKVGPIMVIFDNFGLLVSFTLGLALPSSNFDSDPMNNWWLFMFLFPACVCFYQFIYFKYFWKLDTPQFYLSKGMKELTYQSIALSYTQEGQAEGLKRVEKEILSKFGSNEEKSEFCKFFRQPRFFKMMRVGISLALINQFSGMAAIIFILQRYSMNWEEDSVFQDC
jgi:MFS family permease